MTTLWIVCAIALNYGWVEDFNFNIIFLIIFKPCYYLFVQFFRGITTLFVLFGNKFRRVRFKPARRNFT